MLAAWLVSACMPAGGPGKPSAATTIAGALQNSRIDEASGLARSQRNPDRYWVVNDDGPSVIYAIDSTGKDLGRVEIRDASNRDWEDVASFTLDGVAYLLIADIGDNEAKRRDVRLYIVEEPEAGDSKVDYAWRIEFSYPQGPRDAEAVAVDVESRQVLVLSKRDIPAILYSLPLQPDSDKRQTAQQVAFVESLRQPSPRDIAIAPEIRDWFWQPTGLDISDDGKRAVILTYSGVYLYDRSDDSSWTEAFQKPPEVVSRTHNNLAESITLNAAGNAIFITLEQPNAPLYRLQLDTGDGQ